MIYMIYINIRVVSKAMELYCYIISKLHPLMDAVQITVYLHWSFPEILFLIRKEYQFPLRPLIMWDITLNNSCCNGAACKWIHIHIHKHVQKHRHTYIYAYVYVCNHIHTPKYHTNSNIFFWHECAHSNWINRYLINTSNVHSCLTLSNR